MSGRGRKRSSGGRGGGGEREGKRGKWSGRTAAPSSQAIPAGQRGVFVTCEAGRERRSGDEVVAMLEEAFEQLGATGAMNQPEGGASAGDAQQIPKQSIDELLAQEVAVLKDKRKDRFKYHDTGLRGSLFVAFPEGEEGAPDPVEVVVHIIERVAATKRLNARYTTRMLPVTHSCSAAMDEIKQVAQEALKDAFPAGEGVQQINFAVEAELRAHSNHKRMDIINALVEHVPVPPHKVNLDHPNKVILVQVIRNAFGMAVVPQYRELYKFNLQRAAEVPEEEEQQQQGEEQAMAQQQAPKAEGAEAAPTAAAVAAAAAGTGPGKQDEGIRDAAEVGKDAEAAAGDKADGGSTQQQQAGVGSAQ